ncbi:MAG TPA: anti-sigma factor [Thermoanaerobaculia bacterium]
MSNGESSSEDLTILAAIESLEQGTGSFRAPRGDDSAETLARLYTEVLGLLPYELAPEEPSPGARKRLLDAIHGDETQPAAAPAMAAVPPRSAQVRPLRAVPAAARRRPPRRWPLALAATLCFLLLGLSTWLYLQLGEQRQTVARLQDELTAERNRAEEAVAAAGRSQSSDQDLRANLAMVASRVGVVGPLRPSAEAPQPGAHGMLLVAADHQHWYLSLEGLQPAEPRKVYKLWFVADGGTVSAGSFTARPGAPVELSSETMPAGTTGAKITLEEDAAVSAPAGPEILRTETLFVVG